MACAGSRFLGVRSKKQAVVGSTPMNHRRTIASLRRTAELLSAREQAEQESARRENLLRKIIEILPVGLWIADKDGKLISANPVGRHIWGAQPQVGPASYGVFKARRLALRRADRRR